LEGSNEFAIHPGRADKDIGPSPSYAMPTLNVRRPSHPGFLIRLHLGLIGPS
jgi:hypothetical protein